MAQTDAAAGPSAELPWGHHWKEAGRVQDYVERTDREAAERALSFKYLVGVVPFARDRALRVLDIGSGHGVVAAVLLDHFPSATAIGLDVSEPMMEIGRARMAGYGSRFRYQVGDFSHGDLPSDLPRPFDLVVSSRAIHHLPADNKRRLYQAVFDVLGPDGCFLNLDIVGPRDEFLKELYRQAGELVNGPPPERASRPVATSAHGHFPDSVADHLRFLTEAGFNSVDCFWKQLGNALIGGFKHA